MNKINGSAIMKVSAENLATTHICKRYLQAKRIETMEILLANKEKSQQTNSTFAIHMSQHSNQKLQKSYFLPDLSMLIYERN